MRHALVVGGTGMLRGVVRALAARTETVSVIARRSRRLAGLVEDLGDLGGRIEPLALDYGDTEALTEALRRVQTTHGPIELAVCWIHGTAPAAPEAVAATLAAAEGRSVAVTLLHVVGSAAADPAGVADDRRVRPRPAIRDRQAILGFVVDEGRSRWLTDDEISKGVLAALESADDPFVVGTVRPWSARP